MCGYAKFWKFAAISLLVAFCQQIVRGAALGEVIGEVATNRNKKSRGCIVKCELIQQ